MKNSKYGKISPCLKENIDLIKQLTQSSADLVIREIIVGGISCAVIATEGMVNSFYYSSIITYNICSENGVKITSADELFDYFYKYKVISPDEKLFDTVDELFSFIYSGFGVILVDGVASAIAFGAQGFSFRSVGAPTTDENIKGAKEGFTEAIKINQSLIRRRIKSPDLVFESVNIGNISKTECAIAYLSSCVSNKFLKNIRKILNNADMDMVLESGSIKMLLCSKPLSLFSEIGSTERPDTLAKKLYEGKIGILIDGTPFVLIVPFLFAEHFHSLDDYEYKAIYASFLRFLKYVSFLAAFLLPGLYVAIVTFHPEILTEAFHSKIIEASQSTPYSLLTEALVIHFAYEIMREAGLRLPKEIGHAVSIVGGLIIGDAAVSAGIVSAPMVIVAALSAISAFVVPALMDSLVMLRFLLIILGGLFGMYGIAIGAIPIFVNICAKTVFGVPYSSSISPTSLKSFTSFLYKSPRQQFASPKTPRTYEMPGYTESEANQDYPYKAYESKFMQILLTTALICASSFSIFVLSSFAREIIMPKSSLLLLSIPFFIFVTACISCDFNGINRALKPFTAITVLSAIVLSFCFAFNGFDYHILMSSLVSKAYLSIFLFADTIILLLFIPFLEKNDMKSLFTLILLGFLCLLIFALLMSPQTASLMPLSILFITALEFIKLIYAVNLIDSRLCLSKKYSKNLKPAVSLMLFAAGWILILI